MLHNSYAVIRAILFVEVLCINFMDFVSLNCYYIDI